jgi:hypothetical protein
MADFKLEGVAINGEKLTIRTPKKVAEIVLCGALHFDILDTMQFIMPTEEQIKNLKETFCIDVKLFDEISTELKGD